MEDTKQELSRIISRNVEEKLRRFRREQAVCFKEIILDAVLHGIHVDILVRSRPEKDLAEGYVQRLGCESEFMHVLPALDENAEPGHVRIRYTDVCASALP